MSLDKGSDKVLVGKKPYVSRSWFGDADVEGSFEVDRSLLYILSAKGSPPGLECGLPVGPK